VVPARFGAAVSNPLSAVVVDGNPTGVLAAPAMSLVTIDEPNVLLVGARQARRGGGLLLRLWEVNGQATTAHVRLSTKPAAKATACNLVEEPLGPLELREGKVAVPIRASGLATVRIE
jgi:alpha-mannosidase